MNNTKIVMASIATIAIFSIAMAPLVPNALAAGSDGSFWGQASSDLGQSGDMGSHSSSFAGEPRSGLGNLKNTFGDWCGLLFFLGFPCI
jgi:hypothetical protein